MTRAIVFKPWTQPGVSISSCDEICLELKLLKISVASDNFCSWRIIFKFAQTISITKHCIVQNYVMICQLTMFKGHFFLADQRELYLRWLYLRWFLNTHVLSLHSRKLTWAISCPWTDPKMTIEIQFQQEIDIGTSPANLSHDTVSTEIRYLFHNVTF